jgi:hypothetical protein
MARHIKSRGQITLRRQLVSGLQTAVINQAFYLGCDFLIDTGAVYTALNLSVRFLVL